jgi:hypothetical protein
MLLSLPCVYERELRVIGYPPPNSTLLEFGGGVPLYGMEGAIFALTLFPLTFIIKFYGDSSCYDP